MMWYEIAIAYESSLILRAQNNIGKCIEIANVVIDMESVKYDYLSNHNDIIGLTSFNPVF